jgi:hypothetical protein
MNNHETHFAKKLIRDVRRDMQQMRDDARREARQARGECHACFYLRGQICGQAFTSYKCRLCEQEFQHPNTAVPKLCGPCAEREGRCRRCCALILEVQQEAERAVL